MFLTYFQSLLVFWNISAQNVKMSLVQMELHADIPSFFSLLSPLFVVRQFFFSILYIFVQVDRFVSTQLQEN
jgi:hypothetical protein